MLNYSFETSNEVLAFLTKNVLISLGQNKELKKIAKTRKEPELDILLHLFPDNEDKVCEVIQRIHKLNNNRYLEKKNEVLKKYYNFILVERKNEESLFLTYDPHFVSEFFNYVLPNTVVLSKSKYEELEKTVEKKGKIEDLKNYKLKTSNIEIQTITKTGETDFTEEEISEDAVKQLDKIIQESINLGASDIHIEVDSTKEGVLFYRVRNRVDGVLQNYLESNNMDVFLGILSQIKLKSGLKLDETRLPQDGRMNYSIYGNLYSFRVSTKPVVVHDLKNSGNDTNREKIVIRKMPDVNSLVLEKLGHNDYNLKLLREAYDLAHGFNIVTGPTGSGKTTLLYAILREIDTKTKNVSTIEDPVEAELKNINQTQTLGDIGLDFARVLRAELRQDPDIIMVGEMRDKETAEIAAEASLTGHLVFSTLHTKNAVSSVTRLVNMGVPSFIVASALSYCIAQRLVRKLCPHCKEAITDKKEISEYKSKFIDPVIKKAKSKEVADFLKEKAANLDLYKSSEKGCKKCSGLGFAGRTAILEIFKINEKSEEIIVKQNANEVLLQEEAEKNGMMTMEHSGLIKAIEGETTLEELYKVLVSE